MKEELGTDVYSFDPTDANKINKSIIKGLDCIEDIRYDGMHCPECSSATVTASGYLWCPNVGCNWGNQLELPMLVTKWVVR